MDIKKGESTLNIMLISIIIVIVVSIGIDSVKKNEININNLGKLNKNNENQQEILLSKGDKLKIRRKYTNRNSKVTGNFK